MARDPHSTFQALIHAWQEYHAAVTDLEDGDAPRVVRAAEHLADAYIVYDDVLFTTFGVEAPFDTYDDEIIEDDPDDDFDDEDVFDDDFESDDGFEGFDDDFDDFDDFDDIDAED